MPEIYDREGIASLLRQKKVPSPRRSEEEVTIRELSLPRKSAKRYDWPWKGEGTFGAAMTDPVLFPLQREGGGDPNLGVRQALLPPRSALAYYSRSPSEKRSSSELQKYFGKQSRFPNTASYIEWRNNPYGGEPVQEREIVLFEGRRKNPFLKYPRYVGPGGQAPKEDLPEFWGRKRPNVEKTHVAKHEAAHNAFNRATVKAGPYTEHEMVFLMDWIIAPTKYSRHLSESHLKMSRKEIKEALQSGNPMRQQLEKINNESNERLIAQGRPPILNFSEFIDAAIAPGSIEKSLKGLRRAEKSLEQIKKSGGMIERNPYPYEARAI